MTAIISYPKSTAVLSWVLTLLTQYHISLVPALSSNQLSIYWDDFRPTFPEWCQKNSSIHVPYILQRAAWSFLSNSTYFYVPPPKKNTSISKKESDKLFLQIRLIKNKKILHRNSAISWWLRSAPIYSRGIGLPRWLSGKEYTCQCRRHRRWEFDP